MSELSEPSYNPNQLTISSLIPDVTEAVYSDGRSSHLPAESGLSPHSELPAGDDYSCTYPNAATCPDCGGSMILYGRCVSCPSCGLEGCGS